MARPKTDFSGLFSSQPKNSIPLSTHSIQGGAKSLFAVCGCFWEEVEVFVPQQPAVAKFVEELPLVAVGADQAGVQEEQDDAGSVVNDNNPVGSSLLAVIVFALGAILVLLCFLLLLLLLSLVADGVFHYCHINSTDRNTAIAYKRSRWMQGMARVVECWREGRTTSKGRLTIAMAFCAILVAREGSPRKDPSKTGTPPRKKLRVAEPARGRVGCELLGYDDIMGSETDC
jgi:hypothetical protein